MPKDNHHIVYNHNVHKWTSQEKKVNCKICLLAENMKDCQACPFYTPAKIDPFLKFAAGYLANIPNGSK